MTFKELMKMRYPEKADDRDFPEWGCPGTFFDDPPTAGLKCPEYPPDNDMDCTKCWNREVPEALVESLKAELEIKSPSGYDPKLEASKYCIPDYSNSTIIVPGEDGPRILDSGNRRQFETGAVRDICEGKGRCDLLPLDVVAEYYDYVAKGCIEKDIFRNIYHFQQSNNWRYLYEVLECCHIFGNINDLMLEVARHFEEGCKKYGDNNWQKGIPTHCYIDSAVRHYLKYLRGDKDEPHDRAFCWNILCCIWTCIHKPELDDYAPKEDTGDEQAD